VSNPEINIGQGGSGNTQNNTFNIYPPIPPLDRETSDIRKTLLTRLKAFWLEDYLHGKYVSRQQKLEISFYEIPTRKLSDYTIASVNETQQQNYPISDLINLVGNGKFTLLVGKGGAGKTIAILQIFEKFIKDAEVSDSTALPILLNLASWREGSISDWIGKEIYMLLKLKKKDFQKLVNKQTLFLILDGLDEVQQRLRPKCIKEINKFYEDHAGANILIGCREEDYEKSNTNLYFDQKFCVQPLNLTQIVNYLEELGQSLQGLREAIKKDDVLQKIAKTPLMLFVMACAYDGITVEKIPQLSQDLREKDIWRNYVNRMFWLRYQDEILLYEKKKDKNRVEKDKKRFEFQKSKGVLYLTNLAIAMIRDPQSIFLIERISDKWFQKKSGLYIYRASLFLIGSIVGVLSCTLIPRFSGFNEIINNSLVLQKAIGKSNLLIDILLGVLFGGGFGIFSSFSDISQVELSTSEFISFAKPYFLIGISMLTLMFVSTFLISYFIPQFWAFIISSLLISAFQDVLASKFRDLDFPSNKKAEDKKMPNEGVWQSVNNSLLVLISLSLLALIVQIFCNWILGALGVNLEMTKYIISCLLMLSGFITVAISLFCGGFAALQHITIRLILSCFEKSTPFNYSKRLDWLADRLFLQKIGGGYIFINRLLMEYLNNERRAKSNNNL